MTYEDNIIVMQDEEPEDGDSEEIDIHADTHEITVPASAAGLCAGALPEPHASGRCGGAPGGGRGKWYRLGDSGMYV